MKKNLSRLKLNENLNTIETRLLHKKWITVF